MTILLSPHQTPAVLEDIAKLLAKILYPHLQPDMVAAIQTHLAWMHEQKTQMSVNTRFETIPELQATKLTITTSFAPLPPEPKV